MQYVGAGDVGVRAFGNEDGIQETYIGVADVSLVEQELLARVTHAFRLLPVGRFHIVALGAIPRNAAGKSQRAELRRAIAAALGMKHP
jgi:acyl-coenzyme A synthetase/AMP-(fatty) acid ligase